MISDNYVTGDNIYLRELQNFFFEVLGMMSITHYGAIGDGRKDNYGALQVAIDDANRRGLSFIYVPYGRFIYTGELQNIGEIIFVGNPHAHIVNIRTGEEIEIHQFGFGSTYTAGDGITIENGVISVLNNTGIKMLEHNYLLDDELTDLDLETGYYNTGNYGIVVMDGGEGKVWLNHNQIFYYDEETHELTSSCTRCSWDEGTQRWIAYATAPVVHSITLGNYSKIPSVSAVMDYTNDTFVKKEDDTTFVKKEGDTMTGSLAIGSTSTASGSLSFAQGRETTASADYSHAEGELSVASGIHGSHAEGYMCTASGENSHAEGNRTVASSEYGSHAEGNGGQASGRSAHAEGYFTKALGNYSHSAGCDTQATLYCQTAIGVANVVESGEPDTRSSSASLFIVGNGTVDHGQYVDTPSNAMRLTFAGDLYIAGTLHSNGADYAESVEWADGNPNDEDRVGKFVVLEQNKMRIANSQDKKDIMGVVSAFPSVLGDSYDSYWHKKYVTDVYGRIQYHEVVVPKEIDEDGRVICEEHTEEVPILTDEYDKTQEYVSRAKRKEFGAFAMLGKLVVEDDGTCVAGGYCYSNDNGIATQKNEGFYVLERIDENHIRIFVR